MEKIDLLIKNVTVYNSYSKSFRRADVTVLGDKFYYIGSKQELEWEASRIIDGTSYYMIPGLVDIHMHIESSMMTPRAFGERAAACGVTTIVSEPHEMANVMGIRGIHEMIQAAEGAPIDIYYGIPSSVPSTDETLETTGGVIQLPMMKKLLEEDHVVCVGEIMNYRQIIRENDLEITKFLEYLKREHPNYIIEGHCPSLVDLDLAKFLYLGIDGDHTEHSLEEVVQRLENGMFMEIQDKMLKPEILRYIHEKRMYEHCSFVTDDTMADELYEQGQLNCVVDKAIRNGFPLEEAIYCATYTPARRMNMRDRGTIAPGRLADFILLEDPGRISPVSVYKNGREIFHQAKRQMPCSSYQFPQEFYHSVHVKEIEESAFQVWVREETNSVQAEVIVVKDGKTQTERVQRQMPVINHQIRWEDSECMLAMVLERHGKNGNIGYGFVTGDCIKEGAVATTYFHDHHNLMVMGNSTADMQAAVNRIIQLQGGIVTVKDGNILEELALPVCGILSDHTAKDIGIQLKKVRNSLQALGYQHYNPIMSLCTLGLPVSPALKLTDCGLVDVQKGRVIPLYSV